MMGELRPWPTQPPTPEHLVRILRRGLAHEPAERFDSLQALIDALAYDPDRIRRRRWLWAGGAVALAGATTLGAVASRQVGDDRVEGDPCDAGPGRVAKVWSPARADALRQALDDPTLPYAAPTLQTVVARLDGYGDAWAQAHREACVATHVRNEQTGSVLALRMACLDQRLTTMGATVDELSRPDGAALLQRAPRVVAALPSVAPCADTATLLAIAPPDGADTRAAVDALRTQIAAAHAKGEVHRFEEARALLLEMGPKVEATHYDPLQAEYALRLASSEERGDKIDDAIASARRALIAGQRSGHDAVVRDAAARLTSLIGIQQAKPEQGLVWADLAEATAARIGWTDDIRATLLRSRAWVLVEWGLQRDAVDVGLEALAAAIAAHGADALEVSAVHSSLGSIYGRLSQMPEAQTHFERVVALTEAHLGDQHPDLIGAYLNLGNALSAQGKLSAARDAFERSMALAEQLPNVSPATRARTLSSLGNLAHNERAWDEAVTMHQRALKLREALHGPEHPLVARTLLSLGNAYTNSGRVAEGTEAYQRSLSIREAAHGKDDPNLVFVLNNLGMHHVRHGAPLLGLPHLRRAAAIVQAHPGDAVRSAENRYWLGRALYDSGVDLAEGGRNVDAAIAALDAIGGGRLRDDAKAWRSEHP